MDIDTNCSLAPYFSSVQFVGNNIITPLHFLLGMPGRIILLIAFYKRRGTDEAYAYQTFVTCAETIGVLAYVLYMLSMNMWSGMVNEGAPWFMRQYILMWYAAHLSAPVANMLIMTALNLALAMAIDRILAIGQPMKYKNFNHKYRHWVALGICCVIGVGTNIFDMFRYEVQESGDQYVISFEEKYVDSPIGGILSQFRNLVQVGAVLVLIACNATLICLYKKKTNVVWGQPAISVNNQAKAKAKKASEKALLLLTCCQSACILIINCVIISFFAAAYTVDGFEECTGFFDPVMDIIIEVADILQFYSLLAMSKSVRRMMIQTLKGVCPQNGPQGQASQGRVLVQTIS